MDKVKQSFDGVGQAGGKMSRLLHSIAAVNEFQTSTFRHYSSKRLLFFEPRILSRKASATLDLG